MPLETWRSRGTSNEEGQRARAPGFLREELGTNWAKERRAKAKGCSAA